MTYQEFLDGKALTVQARGLAIVPELGAHLFPFQREAVAFGLRMGSWACFFDTGLGKTLCELEWATHAAAASNGRALILTPLAVAHLGADKALMKLALQQCGVRTPDVVTERTAPASMQYVAGKAGVSLVERRFCVVVKPTASRGSRGVQLVTDMDRLPDAIHFAGSFSSSVLVEEYLPGRQFSAEAVIDSGGIAHVVGLFERRYVDACRPFFIEEGGEGPVDLPPPALERLEQEFLRACHGVVGCTPCTVKGDLVFTSTGPAVIELALRLSGGYMSSHLIPEMTGIDLLAIAFKLATGQRVTADECRPTRQRAVAIRYQVPPHCMDHTQRGPHCIGRASDGNVPAAVQAARRGLKPLSG